MATQGFFASLELRVQFRLLVCCTYPSWSTVNKEKNRTDQRASLRVDTRETQHLPRQESVKLCQNALHLKEGLYFLNVVLCVSVPQGRRPRWHSS